MNVDLRESWWIRDVEIPTRLVLAPMAGVSVQAFRRQGRRFGAGLVCSEMVSCAGIAHRNERTLGYLRIASDEHPLAIQIFGSEPGAMAEAARMVEAAGADLVDINFGCPVRKVTKTGAGATLLDDPDRACRDRRGGRRRGRRAGDGEDAPRARERLAHLPRRRAAARGGRRRRADAPSPLGEADVHRRADHSLTAELVALVDVPVIASGDVTSRARAQAVLATTGAAAVMVGRAAQGNPWALREIIEGDAAEPSREEVVAELVLFIREAVRELGERRASGFLKKFYGWYLGRGRFPRPFKQEIVVLRLTEEVVRRLLAAAPGAGCSSVLEEEIAATRSARPADLDLRRRLTGAAARGSPRGGRPAQRATLGVPLPDEPQALSVRCGSTRSSDRPRVRGDQVGEAARRDRPGLGRRAPRGSARRSRPPGPRSRRRARLQRRAGRLADHASAARRIGTLTSRAARANSASIEISIPGASTPPTYSPSGETTSKFVDVPKSTTMHGRAVALAARRRRSRSGRARPRAGRRSGSGSRS